MRNKRCIVLIIDGLGVGEMDDVKKIRKQDKGAHTFKHVLKHNKTKSLPNFASFQTPEYFIDRHFHKQIYRGFNRSFGTFNLAHFGADSYMGHQEIAGSRPIQPKLQYITQEKEKIKSFLLQQGIRSRYERGILMIDDSIAVADNIEADYGCNINVVGSLDMHSFDEIVRVGKLVRSIVEVGRVITMGGVNINKQSFFACLEKKKHQGKIVNGINIPRLNIYNEQYQVIHLGYGIDEKRQSPYLASKEKIPVVLIGKAADVLRVPVAKYYPAVQTRKVLSLLEENIKTNKQGLIMANVQETDLSGHRQDANAYFRHLEYIDACIPLFLKQMREDDILLITGDHGNDPTIGHAFHTREKTPLILFSKTIKSTDFGNRKTLADIGASISDFFHISSPEFGTSFL